MNDTDRKLWKYLFPVVETSVSFESTDTTLTPTDKYKAIIREDSGELISIMRDTYKLVPNSEVIKPLVDQLSRLDTRWYIDDSHSFVEHNRMRLQVTFPDLTLNDGKSDIALSLFLHNSYDGSEGIRSFWGAIRGICSNGLIFGKVLSQYYARHTSGVEIDNLKERVESTYDQIPVIKQRIEILQNLEVTETLREEVTKSLGTTITKYVEDQPEPENRWVLFNYLTWYVSHVIEKRLRAQYQMKISKLFEL